MLNQKGQHLKIITAVFSVFVLLLLMAPVVFATDSQSATNAAPVLFTNEFVLNGKLMIIETRIYEAPVSTGSAQATDKFGSFRFPTRGKLVQGYHTGHYAYDIADKTLPPVWASAAGTVQKALSGCETVSRGCGGGYGNHVIIDHGNGLSTLYAHLSTVAVQVGDNVIQGEVIGMMGRSGNVRGAVESNLHFEVRSNGKKENPADYVGDRNGT